MERNLGHVHSVLDSKTEHCRSRSSEQEVLLYCFAGTLPFANRAEESSTRARTVLKATFLVWRGALPGPITLCFTILYSVKPRLWNLVIFSLLSLMTLLSCSRTYLKHIIKMWKYHCSFRNRFRIPRREGRRKASFPRDHPVLKTSWLKFKYMSVSKNRGNHWHLHLEESYIYWSITTTILQLEFTWYWFSLSLKFAHLKYLNFTSSRGFTVFKRINSRFRYDTQILWVMPSCKGRESYSLLITCHGVETDFTASVDAYTFSTFMCRSDVLLRLAKSLYNPYFCWFFFQKKVLGWI